MARPNSGISLISVLIALALLAATTIAVSRLIVTGSTGSRITRENFVANQIAREGLELIRAQRDTNWFAVSNPKPLWTKGLCDTGASLETLRFDSRMASREPMAAPQPIDPEVAANIKLYRTDDGQLVHDPDGTTETIYSRLLKVDCRKAEAVLPDPASIEVTATVSWETRGTPHHLELKEKLFDWFKITP